MPGLDGPLASFSNAVLFQMSDLRGGYQSPNRETRISEIMSPDGHLFLFRTITARRYIKNFDVKAFGDSHHGFSYSMFPSMPLSWSFYGDNEKDLILVAFQSVHSDQLTYPNKNMNGNFAPQPLLTPGTQLEDIAYYDEVKVPKATENVVAVIRKKFYREIVESHAGQSYSVVDIVREISNHSEVFSPDALNPRGDSLLQRSMNGCSIL